MPDVFVPSETNTEASPRRTTSSPSNTGNAHSENHIHAFSAFCENPEGMSFQSQAPNEKILLFLRRHFITNVPWIITTLVLALFPLVLFALLRFFEVDQNIVSAQLFRIILIFYYLLVFSYAFVNFITWFYNLFIATEKQAVDIDFSEVVFHDVAATNFNLVEDVNYTQSGFIRTLFNYGDLFVQTAGGKENIEALGVPQPAKATRIILDLIGHGNND